VNNDRTALSASLEALGWSDVFDKQLASDETGLVRARIASVHRDRLTALTLDGPVELTLPVHGRTGHFAVGDWVLAEPETYLVRRLLERKTVLERRPDGSKTLQLAAANVDTLFIVTSCNADFNVARLERYLALANQAQTTPVILLTKADTAPDAAALREQAQALQRGLVVLPLDPRSPEAANALAVWCGAGQTVAVIGSNRPWSTRWQDPSRIHRN
jgi:ribosome biogenesis GTPase